jgi:hypothetical protein
MTVEDRREPELALRTVCVLALLSIALIHLLDLPGTIGGDPTQGTLYLLLMGACVASGFVLLHTVARGAWLLAGAIAASTAVAYVLTRTVGLPFDHADIGNWGDPLGIASLFVEGIVILAAGYGIWLGRRRIAPAQA